MPVYIINKGVNKPISFKGLVAQYIWWLAAGILMLMLLYAVLYLCAVNTYVSMAIVGCVGFLIFYAVYRVNNKYGEFGIMKMIARKRLPAAIRCKARSVFFDKRKKGVCDGKVDGRDNPYNGSGR